MKEKEEKEAREHQKDLQEEKQKKERRKETLRQQRIESLRQVQREAVEKEQRLDEERRRKVEEERKRAEARRSLSVTVHEPLLTEWASVAEPRYVPEQKVTKVKTLGNATQPEDSNEDLPAPPKLLSPTLPKLGTQAQIVFDKIEDEDWSFTREDYSHYLIDLQCKERKNASSHRIFQLPKTTIITIERDGQQLREHVFLADDDIKLGSATLPAWKGKQIPFYLRKQLRNLHEKIIRIYTKITKISENSV